MATRPTPDGNSLTATRADLQLVAAHVLARRRWQVSGRFGLRAGPGGLATPAFGDQPEAVRLTSTSLVRERGGEAVYARLQGATLGGLAAVAGADLDLDFSCGQDTPPLGDPERPLSLAREAVTTLLDWWSVGWRALDAVVAGLPAEATPATIQLWPEHFDAATSVALPSGDHLNLGFSPGDGFEPGPYAYVGPWSAARPGDPAFWNAPFGAVLRATELPPEANEAARLDRCVAFLQAGIAQASTGLD
jgi:hypothetical protein